MHGIVAFALVVASVAHAGAAPDSAASAPRRVYSIRDSPGWTPVVDPESSAVILGRRVDAPLVNLPFTGGTANLDDLGRAVCRAVQQESLDSLRALCVTDAEFRDILWREFPQSRPATGLTWEDGWRILFARLRAGTSHAVRDHGGQGYEFVRWASPDSTFAYRNFTMKSRLQMIVKSPDGTIDTWRWLRAVVARKGVWKIYSTDD